MVVFQPFYFAICPIPFSKHFTLTVTTHLVCSNERAKKRKGSFFFWYLLERFSIEEKRVVTEFFFSCNDRMISSRFISRQVGWWRVSHVEIATKVGEMFFSCPWRYFLSKESIVVSSSFNRSNDEKNFDFSHLTEKETCSLAIKCLVTYDLNGTNLFKSSEARDSDVDKTTYTNMIDRNNRWEWRQIGIGRKVRKYVIALKHIVVQHVLWRNR